MTRRAGSAGTSPAVNVADLPPELRKQLEKKAGRRLSAPRKTWPVDEVRRYAIRCLAVLADLSQGQRRRVLSHAAKLNDV